MIRIFLILLCLSCCQLLKAETAVQRTTSSSLQDYQKYLQDTGKKSFLDAYIHLSSVIEMETPLLERCLEEVYLGAPFHVTCFQAVKSLSLRPLNQPRRQVLYAFLRKLEIQKSPQKRFYSALKDGLLKTHADLAQNVEAHTATIHKHSPAVSQLEMNAWRKAVSKKITPGDFALLINGKKIAKLETWVAPPGVFQWTLISNTHEPLIRLGSFSQFASESLKELSPLANNSCKDLQNLEPQKFGLLRLEVFADKKCIAQFDAITTRPLSPHLESAPHFVQIENNSHRHWLWPLMLVAGAGLASSLNGKKVEIQWPSLQ